MDGRENPATVDALARVGFGRLNSFANNRRQRTGVGAAPKPVSSPASLMQIGKTKT